MSILTTIFDKKSGSVGAVAEVPNRTIAIRSFLQLFKTDDNFKDFGEDFELVKLGTIQNPGELTEDTLNTIIVDEVEILMTGLQAMEFWKAKSND